MKTVISLAAGAAMLALSGTASAESINIGGNAAAICTLPGIWQTRTNIGGQFGTFSGTSWTIPETAIANADGTPLVTGEIALRITGEGYCNTPHTIRLSSLNGNLHHTSLTAAPTGFAISRQVKYDAHWADESKTGVARRYGPSIVDWIPTGPGQFRQAVWNAEIPGDRYFDLRLSVRRTDGSANTPLVAGNYSDTVTVTLSPNG